MRAGSAFVWGVVLLTGCAGSRPVPELPPAAKAAPVEPPLRSPAAAAESAFLRDWRQRARAQQRAGCLADAVLSLEVLLLMQPDDTTVISALEALRRRIASKRFELLQRAAQAQARGATDLAESSYLAALALQPDDAGLAEELRALERERNRRNAYKPPRRAAPRRPADATAAAVGCLAATMACSAACAPSP